jgi:ribosomal protein S27E
MTDETDSSRTRRMVYQCKECGHEIVIYELEEQAVFCRCNSEGPPMKPIGEKYELEA